MSIAPAHPHSAFDVIVIGGGHAGIEAACAAARMGSRTLMVTLDLEKIGHMPCNPAVGGIGKGHIVFEISACGGMMPQLCTQTYLQARMLNTRKGPAVQGLRLQIDKVAYARLSQERLKNVPNLTLCEGMVDEILFESDAEGKRHVTGVRLADSSEYQTPTVIITSGTFLNGLVHIGDVKKTAGREGEVAVIGLATCLAQLDLRLGRLKTGTPPRLATNSIDFSRCEVQQSDPLNYLFEFYPHTVVHKRDCHITHTNERTHDIIRANLHRSALYNAIKGVGPRYCPSIEDKIGRFPDKTSHHVFVEPESVHLDEMYPNGLSTSMPFDVQEQYIRSISGFENAVLARPGYAIEYDYVLPDQLQHTLEVKKVGGLFMAGQINGTTGYEEAAGQGLVAGINAHQRAAGKEEVIFDRNESYIGVMIDDLVTMQHEEPYRMFTSRAERRLHLRQDNVFTRLTPRAYDLGLVDEQMYRDVCAERDLVAAAVAHLRARKNTGLMMQTFGGDEPCTVAQLQEETGIMLTERGALTVFAEIKYGPYLEREQREIEKMKQYRDLVIPATLDFDALSGLSIELRQKLNKIRPATIAHAMQISGMTPAAISLLIFRSRCKR